MDSLDLQSAAPSTDTIHQGPSIAITNNISAAVIKVFKGEELQPNELYSLCQNTRWLLRADMGFFIKEYFQNQILTKGLSIVLDEIQKYEGESGERQLFVLAQVWDRFFSEILPTLQAILYPLQGQELTVRQMTLLGFRDLVLMKLSLGDLLCKNRSLIPASITQMLLVLQGIQESRGPSKEYCQLESLVALVVTPYLWNCRHTSCTEAEQSITRAHPSHPEIRITHYISEGSLLSPVLEQEGEVYLERVGNLRRHSVTNAHSDIQLLTVTSRMYSGMDDSCEIID
ncbi:proline-rich protein 5-like isoform X2 [Pimephales promelas]|uniref:proline-rich protein 5-like isoform X2 n=1 Tax=Pimephales promelas TaxID=90988 RepID=UPI001955CA46|nr:proline-rich protein 5-like isoform X2 [Pimephales promelas]KAG1955701.1 proline-rich protein 5-like [Pimephales promelas]